LYLALTVLGCASSPANSAGESKAVDTPADACIARANAKHAKKSGEPASITVSHVLVKHSGSSEPAGATRSRGDACLRAEEALDKLTHGAKLDEVVGTYSDSKGANGDGALGAVTRDGLDPAFADAAFELDPGQLSNVVETKFGFHIIVRTE